MSPAGSDRPGLGLRRTTWLLWLLASSYPGLLAASVALWVVYHALPLLGGLALKRLFDLLSGAAPASPGLLELVAVLAAVEVVRLGDLWGGLMVWVAWSERLAAQLRRNMLDAQLAGGGPGGAGLPCSPGEAVSRFRDDPDDVLTYLDAWMDMTGVVVFGGVAVAVMARIDPLVTVAVALPLAAMAVASRVLTARVRAYRRAGREATAAVTGFLGDLFGGILTLKSAGAEAAALTHLDGLAATRRRTGLRDRLLADLTESFNTATVDIAVGVILLLAAPALRGGRLSVGDLTLFVSYTGYLVWLPYIGGRLLTRGRQAGVAMERMAELVPAGAPALAARPAGPPAPVPAPLGPLERLRMTGLAAVHPSGRGVHGVDLELERGTLTVICGPVGSGKTTLVRALLGLVPAAGLLRWNGEAVTDRAAFLVPPRCAYVPQVPRLLSVSLADNVLLGAGNLARLHRAVELAALDRDLATMPEGAATLVGARGTRLSGGQVQRVAVARAIAGDPELLVLDDVSSALDVATERLLWRRLLGDGELTVLAVSNRPSTIAMADRVIRLEGGHVAT